MRGDNRGETLVNGEHRRPLWCLVLLADVGYWKFTQRRPCKLSWTNA